jgi:hypothetical protein
MRLLTASLALIGLAVCMLLRQVGLVAHAAFAKHATRMQLGSAKQPWRPHGTLGERQSQLFRTFWLDDFVAVPMFAWFIKLLCLLVKAT